MKPVITTKREFLEKARYELETSSLPYTIDYSRPYGVMVNVNLGFKWCNTACFRLQKRGELMAWVADVGSNARWVHPSTCEHPQLDPLWKFFAGIQGPCEGCEIIGITPLPGKRDAEAMALTDVFFQSRSNTIYEYTGSDGWDLIYHLLGDHPLEFRIPRVPGLDLRAKLLLDSEDGYTLEEWSQDRGVRASAIAAKTFLTQFQEEVMEVLR